MNRFILLSFAVLAVGFYEASGGADFDPAQSGAEVVAAREAREAVRVAGLPAVATRGARTELAAAPAPRPADNGPVEVTRAALNLVSFEAVTAQDRPARAPRAPVAAQAAAAEAQPAPLVVAAPETPIAFAGLTVSAASQDVSGDADIRVVKGSLVNMRSGPGTEYDVVDQLAQATRVEVLTDGGNGWVELRPVDGGPTGWIAAFLLTDG